MSNLPRSTPPFEGTIGSTFASSTAAPMNVVTPPAGAPNIIVILLDDVGFGTCSTFGGPVPTPALDRVARQGLRYNQFHTTALCSPTRASLMTGRNHHTVHMGRIPEGANVFPGYDSIIPKEAGTIAQILNMNGFSTAAFGKWHLTPSWEQTPTGPFDRWPSGLGFDSFYGILSAEASQYEPPMYRDHTPVMPYIDKPNYHMTEDITDEAIQWMHMQRATNPHRPFFLYYATGAMHCPHHVSPEWSDAFRGQFDQGWDELRREIYERQLALGVIPAGTKLTTRPDELPSWEDYPDRYKPVASRLMEVFAGFLAHTDAQVGRLLDATESLGIDDNTIVMYITGDNGASGEGTIHGAWSAPSFQNGIPEDPEWLLEHIDDFGTARCENHYNAGWAWALDSPFQWMKQVASHFGGTRNAMAVQWPRTITDVGGLRTQFHHVIDVFPTLLEAVGLTTPATLNGVEQMPVQGVSMTYSFADEFAPSRRTTQYFEMLGNRAIYHEGWIASCFHGRVPWNRFGTFEFDGPEEKWELYHIDEDFSQGHDLASQFPDKLASLKQLFDQIGYANNVFPLNEPGAMFSLTAMPPSNLGGLTSMTYTPAHIRMPERSVINLKNCSFRITANVVLGDNSQGVIVAQGGNMAGWSLYLDNQSRPVYFYNWFGHEHYVATGTPLAPGEHIIVAEFAYDGGLGGGGNLALFADGVHVGHARIEKTVPIVFSISGETFDIGIDTGSPVGPYHHGYEFSGKISTVTCERLSEPPPDIARLIAEGEFRASLATQ